MTSYRNVHDAFLGLLREVAVGEEIVVRGDKTRELLAQTVQIDQPRERCVLVPGRNNNVFASIAETMWVLAGRNDIDYLNSYLKRAKDYSDDGKTWRGAYGPRLRDWNGIDQLAQIIAILRNDPASRRAVATMFDPDRDFVESKDIPCNNWLHFIARNGKLDLHVAARSTDIWWGFSGINIFEWTLLLEIMAHWLGHEVGRLIFFTSSLHLYERHFDKAAAVLVLDEQSGSPYLSVVTSSQFTTPWEDFDKTVAEWMRLEAQLRGGADLDALTIGFNDPLLEQYIRMIDIFWCFKRNGRHDGLNRKIDKLAATDLAQAAAEFVSRTNSDKH